MLRAMTAPVAHVLVVEDEAAIAETVLYALRSEGYAASHCLLGGEALQRLQAGDIDVVVLDVGLPDLGGFEVCRRLRAQPGPAAQLPVIFLTARNDEVDRVLGLELGADDYMAKPFEPRELVARIQTILRRVRDDRSEQRANIRFDNWRLNSVLRQVVADNGLVVPLSNAEFRLLWVFIERPRRVLSREQLLDAARGRSIEAFDRSIDLLVSRLRQKLGDDPKAPQLIKTVRGEGYLFDARDIG